MTTTSGYRALRGAYVDSFDDSDPWGSNIGWMFALAEFANWNYSALLPGFRPSPMLADMTVEELEESGSEMSTILELAHGGTINRGDIETFFNILSRYDGWLRLAGEDY